MKSRNNLFRALLLAMVAGIMTNRIYFNTIFKHS